MRWPGKFADNARSVRATIFGADPMAAATIALLDSATMRNMARPTRELRIGENYSKRFQGDCGMIQPWPTLTQGGVGRPMPKPNIALPATSAPAAAATPSALARMRTA